MDLRYFIAYVGVIILRLITRITSNV